jgi:hypothetical protein
VTLSIENLASANTPATAQTSKDVSNATPNTTAASSPGDWTQFLANNLVGKDKTSHREGNRRQQVIDCSYQLTARNAVRMAAAVSKLVSAAVQQPVVPVG